MSVKTRFVFLMHPKEFKTEKSGTGRFAHLSLAESEIHMGIGFDEHARVQALLADPTSFPVLLYPGETSINLSERSLPVELLDSRRLTVFLLDGTWACAKKMLKLSPSLQKLSRISFTATERSRFLIKHQPNEFCLSTLEATHELLLVLEKTGLDRYPDKNQMLDLFQQMQEFQLECARNPQPGGYRRKAYTDPVHRAPTRQGKRNQRSVFFKG